MNDDHAKYEELAAGYALGALDEHDRHRFEFHLAGGCKHCEAALRDLNEVAAELACTLKPVSPKSRVRDRLFDRIRLDGDETTADTERLASTPRCRWAPVALAASVLIAVALGYQAYTLQQKLHTEQSARIVAENQINEFQQELRSSKLSAEKRMNELQASLDTLTAPQTKPVLLAGQGPIPGAQAKAFVDPANRRLLLYVYNLPPTPPGKTYQLWLIVDGNPVSAGIFGVNPDGKTDFDARELAPFSGDIAVAVTIEPEGGVPQPTGPMVLLGT